jgi:hypothetical protein
MRAQIARLRTVLDYRRVDYAANDGHADIIATTDEGVTRRLRVAYVDGAEGSYGDRGRGWASFVLRWIAVDPCWRGGEWTTPLVGVDTTPPFLSTSGAHPWPRTLAPFVAIGANMTVVVVAGPTMSSTGADGTSPCTSTGMFAPIATDGASVRGHGCAPLVERNGGVVSTPTSGVVHSPPRQ